MTLSANIILPAETLQNDETALRREWLVTNGIGGYASASLAGANTRCYHGLLCAALNPPLGRVVLLSKLEETVLLRTAEGAIQTFELSANLYPGTLHPQGHHALLSWTAYPAPTWVWEPTPGLKIEKRVWMTQGSNTTYIAYRLLEVPAGAKAVLRLLPLLGWVDYHSEMHYRDEIPEAFFTAGMGILRLTFPGVSKITAGAFPMLLHLLREEGTPFPGTTFLEQPDWFYRFQHPREAERGLASEADLYSPGSFAAPMASGETLVVVADVPPVEGGNGGHILAPQDAWYALRAQQADLLERVETQDAFAQQLTLAAEQFVVQVPGKRSTIIAGYPWFADWGRDTMIALPGTCIATGRPEIARDILLSFAEYVSEGMLPNRFPDIGEEPEYNTVDATLWYFVALYHYVMATGDVALIRDTLWTVLEEIVQKHQAGTRYNIHADPADNLLYAGVPGVQLTWMDAKVGDWVITPRIGKPVEINALWHNALQTLAYFAERLDNAGAANHYGKLATWAATRFRERFPRPDGRGLYDVLDTPENGAPDAAIRPNQVFALSLPFAPIDPKSPVADGIVQTVREELWTPVGLRTLSPSDPAYRPHYGGSPMERDSAYHQGTVWPWPLGAFVEAYYKVHGDRAEAQALLRPLQAHLTEYGVGSLAEIYDADLPHRPNGCIAQAWSIAETLRVWKLLLA